MAPFVKITPKSTKFIDELRKRAASFRSAQIAATIAVPDDLQWWVWLEFGTASRQDPSAPGRGKGGKYPIKPIDRGEDGGTLETLHWKDGNGSHYPPEVQHPGIRPHPFVRTTIPKILDFAFKDLGAALVGEGGIRAGNIKDQLFQNVMPRAIEMIGETLATVAPGTREDGKLDGNTAASVWLNEEDGAYVIDAGAFSPGNPFTKTTQEKPTTANVKSPRPTKALTWDREAIQKIRAQRLTGTRNLKRRTPKVELNPNPISQLTGKPWDREQWKAISRHMKESRKNGLRL